MGLRHTGSVKVFNVTLGRVKFYTFKFERPYIIVRLFESSYPIVEHISYAVQCCNRTPLNSKITDYVFISFDLLEDIW